ncbi:MAG TPA: ATP-binding protein [Blastocatellia bacterium]|nr:ATP-binding protein [Blastocatellia bacterium]
MPADHLATQIAEEIERLIGRIKEQFRQLQQEPVKKQPEILSDLFRSAHTLKAVYSTGGFDEQAGLAHEFERILDSLRFGAKISNKEALQKLEETLRAFEKGIDIPGSANRQVKRSRKVPATERDEARAGNASLIDQLEIPDDLRSALTEFEDHRLAENLRSERNIFEISVVFASKGFDKELAALRERLNTEGEVISVLPEPSPQKGQVEFRLLFATGESQKSIRNLVGALASGIVELKKRQEPAQSTASERTLSDAFAFLAAAAKRLTDSLGKQVEIYQEGSDTTVPATLAEELREPLLHVVRNAVVHGIEEPHVRKRSRKPVKGSLVMHAVARRGNLIIEITDDGAGIDLKEVMSQAVKLGFVKSNAKLPRAERLDLIFLSGFTTTSEADLASGRGIGLDVVARFIEREKGSISLKSRVGKGTSFTIKLPLNKADE